MANLIVKKACKDAVKTFGKRCPDSTIDALDAIVSDLLKKANKRADSNNRKTLMSYDL